MSVPLPAIELFFDEVDESTFCRRSYRLKSDCRPEYFQALRLMTTEVHCCTAITLVSRGCKTTLALLQTGSSPGEISETGAQTTRHLTRQVRDLAVIDLQMT